MWRKKKKIDQKFDKKHRSTYFQSLEREKCNVQHLIITNPRFPASFLCLSQTFCTKDTYHSEFTKFPLWPLSGISTYWCWGPSWFWVDFGLSHKMRVSFLLVSLENLEILGRESFQIGILFFLINRKIFTDRYFFYTDQCNWEYRPIVLEYLHSFSPLLRLSWIESLSLVILLTISSYNPYLFCFLAKYLQQGGHSKSQKLFFKLLVLEIKEMHFSIWENQNQQFLLSFPHHFIRKPDSSK